MTLNPVRSVPSTNKGSPMLKHYATFSMPGTFFSEDEEIEVKDRIPAHLSKIPKDTYAIYFWDREEAKKGKEVLLGDEKNESVRIIFGTMHTLEEIAKLHGKGSKLYRNIKNNGDGKKKLGILCIPGNWQAYQKGDVVLAHYKDIKSLTEAI